MDIRFAGFGLNLHERQLTGPAGPVELSGRSFDLLVALLSRPGEVVPKADLLDAAWPGVAVEENTLHVHLSSLRRIVGQGLIATVHGRGYKYVGPAPERRATETAAAAAARRGNLPGFRPPCVARDDELASLARLIGGHRLITVVGPGGVGKTTLAIEAAARAEGKFADGAWLADLAAVAGPAHVAGAIVQAMGMALPAAPDLIDALAEHLRGSELLLVIDNCEHVAEAAAEAIKALAQRAPRLRILATSQVPLGIGGEQIFKLAPFALQVAGAEHAGAQALDFFRHCYGEQGETLADAELPMAAKLCTSLDGLALALKMAAARAAALGLAAVSREIAREAGTLSASWEAGLPRHASLAAALAWSHGLLAEDARRCFRRLSAFSGSFAPDAARAVAGPAAAAGLVELLRRSLAVRDTGSAARYRLLETSRHFALAHLRAHDDEQAVRDAHAAFYCELFEASLADWEMLPDSEWLARYGPDMGNLRGALDWTGTQGRQAHYARLATAAYRLWVETGLAREGLGHCETALRNLPHGFDEAAELRLRLALAELAQAAAMQVRAHEIVEPLLPVIRAAGDRVLLAQALAVTAFSQFVALSVGAGEAVLRETENLLPELETSKRKAHALVATAMRHFQRGAIDEAEQRAAAGLAMHRAIGSRRGGFRARLLLAEFTFQCGLPALAIRYASDLLAEMRRASDRLSLGYQLNNLAAYHFAAGAHDQAREALLEAVELVPHDESNWHMCLLQNAAALEAATGDPRRAARLMGFLDRVAAADPDFRQPTEQLQCNAVNGLLEAALAGNELAALKREGAAWSFFEANAFAGFPAAPVSAAPV